MSNFVHLHNHTDFSLLDGAAPVKGLVAQAKEMGFKSIAITDHGNMFGVLRFFDACKSEGIKPIIGCEAYVAAKSRHDRTRPADGSPGSYHMVLLAKNDVGYKNLMYIISMGYTEGFYYRPRIDDELLEKYHEGIIALSACLGGEIPKLIMADKYDEAKERAHYYNNLFGQDHFYLEVQDHGIPEQKMVNEKLVELSKDTGIPLVATNDLHYIKKEHANAQDILICIGTNKKKADPNRMKFDSQEFYLKSGEEMEELFGHFPGAIENTAKIADMCDLEITRPGPLLPDYDIPPEFDNPDDYLRHISNEGLRMRYPEITEDIQKRLDFELHIIISMGFTGYFLIVWDFIHWAKQHDIPVGPGRGSGAGSIVAYALTITDIDPLQYNLLFERFLNPERVSMPDFDIDFCFERRQEVIDYVTRKYGKDKVGQIITFGTLKAKAVLKDVARVLDIPYAESDMISKLVPDDAKKIAQALDMEPELMNIRNRGGVYEELFETAQILEGLSRHASTHAAGIVIGQDVLTEYVPLYRDSKTGAISTEFTMDYLEECGLVKMDFLGLKTLTLIKNTEKLIQKEANPDFDAEKIPETDEKTFKLLGEGKSTCVFQFESPGMQKTLKSARPTNIEDLIALNALYRPGPMDNIPQFVDSKWGRMEIRYPHPNLENVLKDTYGVIVYQEQVMEIVRIIGGFSLGQADILRRAMGKKKVDLMAKMRIEYMKGAAEQGISEKKADEIFDLLKPFAGYGFNKSHAAAYSVLAYKTAYLKANYPAEFMAANLTNEINNPTKLKEYISEAKTMGIDILPPDINLSEKHFTVVNGKIVYGLMAVKNTGEAAVEQLLTERDTNGDFLSFSDLLERINLKTVNKRVLETGINSGVFDSLEKNRAKLMHNLERLMEYVTKKKESSQYGQTSLFEACEEEVFPDFVYEEVEDWPHMEKLKSEKENLGFYISGHPLDDYLKIWERATNLRLDRLESIGSSDKKYTILGLLIAFREIITRKGTKMGVGTIEDYRGSIDMVLFPKTYEQFQNLIQIDTVIGVVGQVDNRNGMTQIKVDSIKHPSELGEYETREIHIKMENDNYHEESLYSLRAVLLENKGACQVYLHIKNNSDSGNDIIMKVSNQINVSSQNTAITAIKNSPYVIDVWKE